MTESQGEVEVCAKLLGTLKNEVQVHIAATDITAIGKCNLQRVVLCVVLNSLHFLTVDAACMKFMFNGKTRCIV